MTLSAQRSPARSADPRPAAGGEEFETAIVGYALTYRFAAPRYYFRLHPPSPRERCRWIWPSLADGTTPGEAITFLLEAFKRGDRMTVRIGEPLGEHRGEPVARAVDLSTLTDLAVPRAAPPEGFKVIPEGFKVISVRLEKKASLRRALFDLDRDKEGSRVIVFEQNEGEELKNLLLRFLESGEVFDFHVRRPLPEEPGACEIDAVTRTV
jgi:hypothetical protein